MKALARRYRTEVLLVVATLVLFLFYYVARPDAIGTRGQAGDWFTVTLPALAPTLHFVASALLLGVLPVAGNGRGRSDPFPERRGARCQAAAQDPR